MKTIILSTLVNLIVILSFADHGPRIQFIHNSPAQSVASIDLWYNWTNWDEVWAPTKIAESFDYKKATTFSTYTLAFGDLIIYVTPEGSSDTANYLFKKTFGQPQIDYYETFVVVLSGTPGIDFDMILNDGQEESDIPFKTSASIFHGSPDAPAVDITEVSIPAGLLVSNLEYEESSDYLNLDPLDYVLQVQTTDGISVAEFDLPLSSFAGKALFVAATGYLDTTGINPNEPFKLIAATPDGSVIEIDPNEILTDARVQVIHNSADAAAEVVDVWLNDELLLDNFEFRTASPFIDAPAGEEFTISIKGPDSMNPDDPIWSQNYTLASGETYILVAEGIVSTSGYNPPTPFDLAVFDMGREEANSSGDTDLLVHHGSTDAPAVDVVEVGVGYGTIVDDISYGEFDGYLELPTANYVLNLFEPENGTFATFEASLATLGLEGEAITIVASGFLNPENNNNGEELGLWVALASGGDLVELPLIPPTPLAYFQVIHNSADAAAQVVDVWLDDVLALDNFAFRTASPTIGYPAGEPFTVSIKGPDSNNPNNPIWSMGYTLEEDKIYILVAEGIVNAIGYNPPTPFDIAVYDMGQVMANNTGNVDVLIHHGSTDAPTVDVYETGVGAGEIVDDLSYSEFAGYLELPTDDYTLEIRDETCTSTVATYLAPLATLGLEGASLVVVASGFLNPAENNNGPAFGLWAALPFGGPLLELPSVITSVETNVIEDASVRVYPNPTTDLINLNFTLLEDSDVNIYLFDMNGKVVKSESYGSFQKTNHSTSLKVNDLKTGLYHLNIQAGQAVISRKIQVIE